MLSHSDPRWGLLAAESRAVHTRCELRVGGVLVADVKVVDGQVTGDRGGDYRYGCDLTLAPDVPVGRDALSPYKARLHLFRGFRAGDEVLELPAGVYRVKDVDSGLPRGRIQVTGQGLEAYLRDDDFPSPRVFPGGSAIQALTQLVDESVPGRVYVTAEVADVSVASAVWESRWGGEDAACQMLARALGAEVFADAAGRFVIRPTPSLADPSTVPVSQGAGGTLVRADREVSRDGAANVVIATSSRTDGGAEVAPGLAWDSDPFSPTFAGPDPFGKVTGEFGRALRRYSSPLLESAAQTQAAARSVLADSMGLLSNLSVRELVNPAREPGDVVPVDTDRGREKRLLDRFAFPVGPGEADLSTRVLRVVA